MPIHVACFFRCSSTADDDDDADSGNDDSASATAADCRIRESSQN